MHNAEYIKYIGISRILDETNRKKAGDLTRRHTSLLDRQRQVQYGTSPQQKQAQNAGHQN